MNSYKNISLLLLILIVLTFASGCSRVDATTFYISNSGNDRSNGKTPQTAWKTIGRVNSQSFIPGDSILFEKGGVWREPIRISGSGKDGSHIVYSSYGKGERPRILGSVKPINWIPTGVSNIWKSETPVSNPMAVEYGAQIFFEEKNNSVTWGVYQKYNEKFTDLTREFDWTWDSKVIYVFADADPDSKYKSIEIPQSKNGVIVNSNAFFTLNGLFIGYLASAGVRDTYGDVGKGSIKVTNCEIAYIGYKNSEMAYGLSVTHSNSYYAFNTIHDCGRRSISINLYATSPVGTMENVLIENNHFYHGWHTTGVDCINSGNHSIKNIVVRNNYFEGTPGVILGGINSNSNHLFIANQSGGSGTISDILVYNNIFTYGHGKHIGFENINTAKVFHNTFYGWNPTLSNGQAIISYAGGGNKNITIKNNIFYNNAVESFNRTLNTIFVKNPESVTTDIDYNLYYNTDPTAQIFEFFQTGGYDREYTMAGWKDYRKQYPAFDAHSPIPSNPLFSDPAKGDFSLKKGSPAIGAGEKTDWILKDYFGNEMNSPPDLGAIQFRITSTGTLPLTK